MVDWIPRVIEFLKLPVKYVWAIAIASGFILFAPPQILAKIRLDDLQQQYGVLAGITFLLSAVLTAIHAAPVSGKKGQRHNRWKEIAKVGHRRD
jgi:hypothetical protein